MTLQFSGDDEGHIQPPNGQRHNRHVDDHELAQAIVAGDRDAFRLLVDRESGPVVRACTRVLGNAEAAEDVAQECFVTAFQLIGTWRGEGSLHGWLLRIAVNRALRAAKSQPRLLPLEDETGEPAVIAGGTEPLNELLTVERDRTVQAAVASLPEPYRETIVLRYFGELSIAEIAAATGRPIGTVKTHLGRGLLRLRPVLAEDHST
jgi:RNA polymerase sigma-70 factor, ECF subfamily